MRDPKRIPEVLEAIGYLWQECPDLRLCQLILNLRTMSEGTDMYNVEDDDLLKRVKLELS